MLLGLLVLILLPALSFVALFRLIDYVAHDELVARVQNGEVQSVSPTGQNAGDRPDRAPNRAPPSDERVVCTACEADNWDHADYCWNCLAELP